MRSDAFPSLPRFLGAPPGDYLAALLTTAAAGVFDSNGQNVAVDARLAVMVNLRVEGTQVLEVTLADVQAADDGPWWNLTSRSARLGWTVTNESSVTVTTVVTVTVRDWLGWTERTVVLPEITLRPGTQETTSFGWAEHSGGDSDSLPATGWYDVEVSATATPLQLQGRADARTALERAHPLLHASRRR